MKRNPTARCQRSSEIRKLVAYIQDADKHPELAERAELKLKKFKNPDCIKLLLPILVQSYPPWTASTCAIRVLHALRARDRTAEFLGEKLRNRNWKIRASAASVLESFTNPKAFLPLKTAVRDINDEVRTIALHTLGILALDTSIALERRIVELCANALKDASHGVRRAGFEALSHLKIPRCQTLLKRAAADPHPEIRAEASDWLKEWKYQRKGKA